MAKPKHEDLDLDDGAPLQEDGELVMPRNPESARGLYRYGREDEPPKPLPSKPRAPPPPPFEIPDKNLIDDDNEIAMRPDVKTDSYAHGGMVRKPEVKRASYARGGKVMERSRDFLKSPDQFRGETGKYLPKTDFGKK